MHSRLDLGVGLVLLPGYEDVWDQLAGLVDVIEVEPATAWWQHSEGAWSIDPDRSRWWASLPQPKLCHGVGFPVGGSVAPHAAAVELFAQEARHLGASLTSEHLSFNRTAGGAEAGFLLPPHQSWAGVEAAVEHVRAYQRAVGDVPFSIETGVSYLRPCPDELTDGRFVAAIAERSDCGILLDLHNVWANARNGRQPVEELLDELPLDRVTEVHLAGGFELGGCWLDAHSGTVDRELLGLAADVLPRLPSVRAIVFELLPAFLPAVGVAAARRQLEDLHRLVEAARTARPRRLEDRSATSQDVAPAVEPSPAVAEAWETALLAFTTRRGECCPVDDEQGAAVLRLLTDHARLGRIVAALPAATAWLFERLGESTDAVMTRYLAEADAHVWVSAEAQGFASWLTSSGYLDPQGAALLAAEVAELMPPVPAPA